MRAFYNEFDPKAAAWLRELVSAGLCETGCVDERSIAELRAADLDGFARAHFFAGIGGWDYALRLADWPVDRPVWTGSCPCQPYSSAGKGKGNADERDLWPAFARLIRECRPQCVFGEQVSAAIRHGWLDRVHADMEAEGYTVGACVLGAHSVGAPHIRQRLFWVAHLPSAGPRGRDGRTRDRFANEPERLCTASPVPDSDRERFAGRAEPDIGPQQPGQQAPRRTDPLRCGIDGGLADAVGQQPGSATEADAQEATGRRATEPCDASGGLFDFWRDVTVIECRDGKRRRVPTEPGLFPLAHGVPGRVAALRGAGNAIVPQVAALFIRAFLDEGN